MERIVVCITPQSNSHRLIDRAAEEAEFYNGELFILNVQKGHSVFANDNSLELLETLFNYGSRKGGTVHALAGDDALELISNFIIKNKITKAVLGEPPAKVREANCDGFNEKLMKRLKHIEFIILKRENDND